MYCLKVEKVGITAAERRSYDTVDHIMMRNIKIRHIVQSVNYNASESTLSNLKSAPVVV